MPFSLPPAQITVVIFYIAHDLYTTSTIYAMPEINVPQKGKAAVVVNEGPDFHVEVQEVDVPEPSE